jgi:phage baseplate assembly protein W
MSIVYYKIPFQFSEVMDGRELPVCDLITSVIENLELIIMTRFGEHRSNPGFGCEIWDLDFELIVSASLWEEKLRQSLVKSITTHETRLSDIDITVAITDLEKFNNFRQFVEIKKRVEIHISGVLHKTGEPVNFRTNLFLSPLSVD